MESAGVDFAALGRAVKTRREQLGWSTNRLSKRAGVSWPQISTVEDGGSEGIGLLVLAKLSRALGMTLIDLFREGGILSTSTLPDEIAAVYWDLGEIERRAWVRHGGTLRQVQQEYAALLREDGFPEEPSTGIDRAAGPRLADLPAVDPFPPREEEPPEE